MPECPRILACWYTIKQEIAPNRTVYHEPSSPNSLFHGSQICMLEKLHKVQNSTPRLIFQCRKQNHISPLLTSLHWLPIKTSIDYKLSVICHSSLGMSPIYLSDLLSVYTPKRNLHTSDNRILCSPNPRTKTFRHL